MIWSVAFVRPERTPAALPFARNSSSTWRHTALDCNFSGVDVTGGSFHTSVWASWRAAPRGIALWEGSKNLIAGPTWSGKACKLLIRLEASDHVGPGYAKPVAPKCPRGLLGGRR